MAPDPKKAGSVDESEDDFELVENVLSGGASQVKEERLVRKSLLDSIFEPETSPIPQVHQIPNNPIMKIQELEHEIWKLRNKLNDCEMQRALFQEALLKADESVTMWKVTSEMWKSKFESQCVEMDRLRDVAGQPQEVGFRETFGNFVDKIRDAFVED